MGTIQGKKRETGGARAIPISHNTRGAYGSDGDVGGPESQDEVQGTDLEGDEDSFVKEEVPAGHETPGVVDPDSGVADERGVHGHEDGHLGHGVVYQGQHAGVRRVRNEQTARTTVVKGTADTDEQRRSDSPANGDEHDLAVTQVSLQAMIVVDHLADVVLSAIGLDRWGFFVVFFVVHGACQFLSRDCGIGRLGGLVLWRRGGAVGSREGCWE